ncbi:hypothetical protein D915_006771 [Fasciola hepatica]|uniref:Uncharacterized protein n=1 Tax=Fasciola hepatica TaxID=6192 RepID=A0A4E0R4C3_FASHE|nr:hypothetical protein D915_006771 [Fasciola hepatica]
MLMTEPREPLENININFIPSTYFVPCAAELAGYAKTELSEIIVYLEPWSLNSEDIRLMDSFFIRFKNQLRHFMFFKAFCAVMFETVISSVTKARRCIRKLCVGPQRKGISSFQSLITGCDDETGFPGLPRMDHLLVCIYQCCHMMHIALDRLIHCWKICDMQFSTGHFTKVLLLIMTLLGRFRAVLLRSFQGVCSVYENLHAVRNGLPDTNTWLCLGLPQSIPWIIEKLPVTEQSIIQPAPSNCVKIPNVTVTGSLSVRDKLFDSLIMSKTQSKHQLKKLKRKILQEQVVQLYLP